MLVALAAVVVGAQTPSDDRSFEALYRRGAAVNADLRTLTARFTETTTSSILTRPLEATGVLAVERPSKVILHYREPEVRDVLIDGDRMSVSWPARDILEVTNIATANRRIQRYFVDSSPDRLRDSFDILSGPASDRVHAVKLTMVPRRSQIREGLSRLDLWLDETSLLLVAMQMTFPNGDAKLMVLDDVQVNVSLPQGTFSLARAPAPAR